MMSNQHTLYIQKYSLYLGRQHFYTVSSI